VPLIAIDGPSGSGKSTVARALASRLGWAHLDTGAMYRAVTLAALERGVDPEDGDRCARIARESELEIGEVVVIDGKDVTKAIRSEQVDRYVSAVAAHPGVRTELVARQRAWAATHPDGVVEGRDIATVVLPDAALAIYLVAEATVRARRRLAQSGRSGFDLQTRAEMQEALGRRDERDRAQSSAAERLAETEMSHRIDSTSRSVEEIVDEIVNLL
jgi:cytidylate kinase